MTIQEVIDIIMAAVPGEPLERTSDTFKAVSEQPGMRWFLDWLRPHVPEVPLHFVPTRDPFVPI
jgi:hypothetical protein